MRTLTLTLAALTLTPSFAGAVTIGQRIGRALAPVRASLTAKHGVGLVTYGKGGKVISTTRQRLDGTQVTRERQTHFIDGVRHGAQVKTVTRPNGVSTTTTHVFGQVPEVTESQGKYKPLTPARAVGKAIWASPATKAVAFAGLGAVTFAGEAVALAERGWSPARKVVNVESEKTVTVTIPKQVTISRE